MEGRTSGGGVVDYDKPETAAEKRKISDTPSGRRKKFKRRKKVRRRKNQEGLDDEDDFDEESITSTSSKASRTKRKRKFTKKQARKKSQESHQSVTLSRHGKIKKKVKRRRKKANKTVEFDIRLIKTDEEILRHQKLVDEFNRQIQEKADNERAAMIVLEYLDKDGLVAGKRSLTTNFLRCLKPIVCLGKVFGRWPFLFKALPDGSGAFTYKVWHPGFIYFLLVNIIYFILFAAGVILFFCYFMNIPVATDWKYYNRSHNATTYLRNRPARIIFDRHSVFFISSWRADDRPKSKAVKPWDTLCTGYTTKDWTMLLHDLISGCHIFHQRKFVASYLTFWLRVITTMNMDVSKLSWLPVIVVLGFYAFTIVLLSILSLLEGVSPGSKGLPAVVAVMLGTFDEDLLTINKAKTGFVTPTFSTLLHVGKIILIFLTVATKCNILLFMVICKFLKNAFSTWNGRVYRALLRSDEKFINTKVGRTVYSILFKDHVALLDLLEGTDRTFSSVLESYFGLSALSFCFELYFFIFAARDGHDEQRAEKDNFYIRGADASTIFLVVTTHIGLMTYMLHTSAGVYEEAMAGLEVIRRKTMMGRKTDEELYFLMSVFSSFTSYKPMGISAGGFFLCSKAFNVGVFAVVVGYFTIVVQFKPHFDFQRETGDKSRQEIKEFLHVLEGGQKLNSSAVSWISGPRSPSIANLIMLFFWSYF